MTKLTRKIKDLLNRPVSKRPYYDADDIGWMVAASMMVARGEIERDASGRYYVADNYGNVSLEAEAHAWRDTL